MACKGVVFALELGLLPLKEKTAIRSRIEAAGGTVNPVVSGSVRVLITTTKAQAAGGYKIETANSLGVAIFLVDDLDEVLAFPPSPRQLERPSSRIGVSRIGVASTEKKPLIVWDEPLALPDPPPSFNEALPSLSSSYGAQYASSSSNDLNLFSVHEDVSSSSAPFSSGPSSFLSSSRGVNSLDIGTELDENEDGFSLFAMDLGDDFSAEISSAPIPKSKPVPKPKPSAKELLESKLASLSKTLSPEAFKSLTGASSSSSSSRASSRVGVSSSLVSDTSRPSEESTSANFMLKRQPSDAMAARAAKYHEITSKSAAPLVMAPIQVSQPTFTPLTFDLKPAATKSFVPRFGVSSRASSSSSSAHIAPIVFESMVEPQKSGDESCGSSLSTTPVISPRSSVSLVSSRTSSAGTVSERSFDGLNAFECNDTAKWADNDEDVSGDDEHGSDDFDDEMGADLDLDESMLTHQEPMVVTEPMKRRKMRQPRQYLDRRTGVTWQRKSMHNGSRPLNKLILESGSGVTKVFKLNQSATLVVEPAPVRPVITAAPSVPTLKTSGSVVRAMGGEATGIKPFNAASLDEFCPPLPRAAPSKVVKQVITGPVVSKFSWVDIVTGKASTTKRVPAMDGLKVFVSGVTFDDLKLHGQSREAQLPSYKAEHLKKIKEKNEKALRKLRKKARKAALEKATADEEGKLIPVDKTRLVLPKQVDGAHLARMKTDEQLLNEIVVWPQRRLDAAIQLRQSLYRTIFTRFGEIAQFKPEWDRGFIHITYKNTQSARACMRALKDFDLRNACIRSLSESQARTPDIRAALPSPSFYVRWTTCYQRKLNNKTKKVAEEKQKVMDAAIAKHASQAASEVAKIPNKL